MLMDKEQKQLSPEAKAFFDDFFKYYIQSGAAGLLGKSTKTVNAALIYEKIRTSMEYQEEHLVFKNAIARIIRRKYTLAPNMKKDALLDDLLRELGWANYINIETFEAEKKQKLEQIIGKYLIILQNVSTSLYWKMDLSKRIIDWMACEIEEFLIPKKEDQIMVSYASKILLGKLNLNTKKIIEEDSAILVRFTVFSLLLKPDLPLLEYFLLNELYPDWQDFDDAKSKQFARSFDPYYNKVVKFINHPLKNYYSHFVRENVPPFIVMRTALMADEFTAKGLIDNPDLLERESDNVYKTLMQDAKSKVLRGSLRALVFILLTKAIFAFLLEVPFDKFLTGSVNYLSLAINLTLPPILMLIAGVFTKSPPEKNKKLVLGSIEQIMYDNKIGNKVSNLIPPAKNKSYQLFNFIYSAFNYAILYLIVWLLFRVGFNILSVILFFLFVSLVSFFSFRIRNMALHLAMRRVDDDMITSVVEFFFLPFIKIGKYISSKFSSFNPFILIIDLLIEAPLKSIIRIMGLWKGFVNSKKDELELE